MLLIDGVKYILWTPENEEKEFHPMIREHSKEIFGKDSIYFDIKHKLISRSGIGSIPDAYVISLSKPYQWYIVENELSTHRVYEHIVPQVSRFISGIENLRTQREIRDVLYNEIIRDRVLKASVEKMTYPEEIHRFLSSLVSKPPKVALIIDEVTAEVREASRALKRLAETKIVEFKTYVREDAESVRAHLFKPIFALEERIAPPTAVIKAREERKRKLPEHYESWEKRLAWVDDKTKKLVEELSTRISELGEVNRKPMGRWYVFYRGEPHSKFKFVVFLLTKHKIRVRIRADPTTFRDPERLLKERVYVKWFFHGGKGQEREFPITDKKQIDYAMELIKQSYELAK